MDYLWNLVTGSWTVAAQMAPYLLLGFLAAGVLSVLVSPAWVERHLGGRGFGSILKAVLFGIPLPLCSCGVIPVTASIRKHGASRGATTGFLLATPQTGVDSILATWGTLGPVFGVFRPLVALVTGVVGGAAVSLLEPEAPAADGPAASAAPACTAECCAAAAVRRPAVVRALTYGFRTLPRDIGKALLLGILVAGIISAFVKPGSLVEYLGGGPAAMLVMVLVGIPIYVCSTASIPVALGFIHMGASPGAALAFLIAGPATNAATIAMTWKVLGRRTAVTYLLTVAIGAMLAGLGLDAVIANAGSVGLREAAHVHPAEPGWFHHAAAVVLLGVVGGGVATGLRKRPTPEAAPEALAAAEKITLRVTGMTCSHCAAAVTRGLTEVAGVAEAAVDLAGGTAAVTGSHLDPPALLRAVERLGYSAQVAADVHAAQTVILAVAGMTCSDCAATIERDLREAPGVIDARVDLAAKRAVVAGEALDTPALLRLVQDLGYHAELIAPHI